MSLADDLAEWTDWDLAADALGRRLGVLKGSYATQTKGIHWTNNPLGAGLHDALLALVRAGVLERREDPDEQFKWRGSNVPRVTLPDTD